MGFFKTLSVTYSDSCHVLDIFWPLEEDAFHSYDHQRSADQLGKDSNQFYE